MRIYIRTNPWWLLLHPLNRLQLLAESPKPFPKKTPTKRSFAGCHCVALGYLMKLELDGWLDCFFWSFLVVSTKMKKKLNLTDQRAKGWTKNIADSLSNCATNERTTSNEWANKKPTDVALHSGTNCGNS